MNKAVQRLKETISVGHPVIQIVSYEENRVEKYLKKMAEQLLKTDNLIYWDVNSGSLKNNTIIANTTDPILALSYIIDKETSPGIFIFRDLSPLLRDSVEVTRKLREAYLKLKNTKRFIVLLSPDEYFPDLLKKEIEIIRFDLPDYDELASLFTRFLQSMEKSGKTIELSEEDKKKFVIGSQGLTLDEAYKAYLKCFQGKDVINIDILSSIHEEKRQLIQKESVLEFYPHKFSIDDLGGLDNLKDWLQKRRRAYSKEAQAFGLQKPKGCLFMGVSGCGKSLSAKVIAALWELPLFRLDMNLVYSGMGGSPEIVFSRALKTMDSVAPAVLWLDEIESGISDKVGEGSASRILGYFLTWMQEHDSEVFIAATANRIDALPAELLRRGRFDQIFFIDLPTRKEREEIFSIHLKSKGNDTKHFNIPQLSQITKGWTGSEIEQVIVSGMFEAFNQNRKLNEDDLFAIFGSSVPLAVTMEEQIKKIRSWAHNRAARASSDKEY